MWQHFSPYNFHTYKIGTKNQYGVAKRLVRAFYVFKKLHIIIHGKQMYVKARFFFRIEEITHPIYGEIKKQDMVLLRNKPVKFEWHRNYFIVTPQYMYI